MDMNKKKNKGLAVFFYSLAAIVLLYFIMLMMTIGPEFYFNYFWLIAGLFFLGMALVLTFSKRRIAALPKPALFVIEILVFAGCLLFIFVEAMIIRQSMMLPEQEAEYLIVLGAKVNGRSPSLILKYRIQKAAEYLNVHNDVRVVVSGGKGSDENISEAEAMYNGLVELGIAKERILMEDRSTSTKENLDFSAEVIAADGHDIEQTRVLVVTTDFHVLRALKIAKKAGYQNVEGLAAKSVWYLVPTNYVREFLAVVKDKIVGNM